MRYNFTVDAPSTRLNYSSQWIPNESDLDATEGGTAMHTTERGGSVSLNFNGTAVWVYGKNGDSHGLANVTLDSITETHNGEGLKELQVLIYEKTGLEFGSHSLTIENLNYQNGTAGSSTDIDYIVYEGQLPDNSRNMTVTYDNSAWLFSPPDHWKQFEDPLGFSNSFWATKTRNDEVNMTFIGNTITIYGGLGRTHGNFTCSFDGAPPILYYTAWQTNSSNQRSTLCTADNLGDGQHTVSIINIPRRSDAPWLAIDAAIIWGSDPSVIEQNGQIQKPSKVNAAAIGGVAGGVVALLIIGVLFFLWRKRRRQLRDRHSVDLVGDSGLPPEVMREGHITPFVDSRSIFPNEDHLASMPSLSPGYRTGSPSPSPRRDTLTSYASDASGHRHSHLSTSSDLDPNHRPTHAEDAGLYEPELPPLYENILPSRTEISTAATETSSSRRTGDSKLRPDESRGLMLASESSGSETMDMRRNPSSSRI